MYIRYILNNGHNYLDQKDPFKYRGLKNVDEKRFEKGAFPTISPFYLNAYYSGNVYRVPKINAQKNISRTNSNNRLPLVIKSRRG